VRPGEAAERPPWSEFRAELEAQGFRPSKSLGQNFLLDTNMARAIARDAGVGPGDAVLEIGPGCGFLSVHLLELGVDLTALEIDERLLRVAARFLAPYPGVRLVHGDALAGKHALSPVLLGLLPARPWSLVSNLPYAIAAPLIANLARHPAAPQRMTLLVQRELAERLLARPGTSAWGALSAKLLRTYSIRAGRSVPDGLFWPRPRVESRVIHLDLLGPPRPEALRAYDALVEALFQHRRKTLRAALRPLLERGEGGSASDRAAELLRAAGIEGGTRPEDLDLASLERLSALLPGPPAPEGPSGEA
jgi:16S rRNA (adenine1518-N6/adenine1519-N6)-dimethyltransferase